MSSDKRKLAPWAETIVLIVSALALALVVKTFFIQAFYIPSASMEPTFVNKDRLLVQKVSYWFSEPKRGDIVVFEDPGGWLPDDVAPELNVIQQGLEKIGLFPSGSHLIKRVIAVEGDVVACCDDEGRTTVNGIGIDEPYLASASDNALTEFAPQEVPQGRIWVQGDNRGDSADSRANIGRPGGGMVPVDLVVGKAWVKVWPLKSFGFVGGTDAFAEVE